MSIVIITPTFNESLNIEKFIIETLNRNLSLLVIDDNSPDGTSEIVSRYVKESDRVFLIKREKKLGIGSAYREGFNWAIENNYEFAIEMDADFSHQFSDLDNLLSCKTEHSVVVGSRYISGASTVGWSYFRKTLSRSANYLAKICSVNDINDMTSGFRIYPTKILKKVDYNKSQSNGYSFQIEMTIKVIKHNFKIVEVPITFVERELGKSKMDKLIVFEAIVLLLKSLKNKLTTIFRT